MGWGKEFYKEQLMLIGSGNIDELLKQHYHEDAVMVTFDGIRRGHAELKEYFLNRLVSIETITYMATDYFAETEDVIIFKATLRSGNTAEGELHADNALVIKDGKISRHIALTILPIYENQGLYDKWGTKWTD
jgi:hypothetical protein